MTALARSSSYHYVVDEPLLSTIAAEIQTAIEKTQMLRDQGAVVEPFLGLSRFTLFAVLWRYDEEPEQEDLDRAAWNQLGADLLEQVASRIP